MMRPLVITAINCFVFLATLAARDVAAIEVENVDVYRVPGRFGGWPANHGIWSWGDEILVGFGAGYYDDLGPERHNIDHGKPEEHLLAHSLDGGRTWKIENPAEQGVLIPVGKALHGVTPPGLVEKPWQDCPGGIDFTHPDFAMTLRMTDADIGPSRFHYSTDRGHTWKGPFRLTLANNTGLEIAARTDYIVNGKNDCLLFLTAAKTDHEEGRVLCARTKDGGKNWLFVSWVGPEPTGFSIMPSTVRLGPAELLTALRHQEESKKWIDLYRSLDDGGSWQSAGIARARHRGRKSGQHDPAERWSRLPDLRLSQGPVRNASPAEQRRRSQLGERDYPSRGRRRSRCRLSAKRQRTDGHVVTTYYYHDQPKSDRYIAATIWDPDNVGQ